jgi:hypothetical protein
MTVEADAGRGVAPHVTETANINVIAAGDGDPACHRIVRPGAHQPMRA